MAARKLTVPAEPFRRILAERIEGLEGNIEISKVRHALAQRTGIHERAIYRILNRGVETISFDNADRIVTSLLGPMAWHSNEELSEIYEEVDLRGVDWQFPTSERVRQGMRHLASEKVRELGTMGLAAEHIGVPAPTLSRYLRSAA